MRLNLFKNAEASALAGTSVFFGNYNQFAPSLFAAVKEAVWGCFATGANKYNGPLWFIYYEFFGTLLIAAILSLLGNSKARYIVYAVCCVLFIRSDFLPFIMGACVCDLTYRQPEWLARLTRQKWLMWLVLIGGILLGSFPPIGERLEGTIYAFLPIKVMFYYAVGASCVLFALLHLEAPRRPLEIRPLLWLNRFSYGFYLVHFMVLCTFSCGLYLALHMYMNYHLLAIINYVLTLIVTVALSALIHHFVEKPGMRLANEIAARLAEKQE
jgi:peptidoglycan/LPS O-acetylase OafA/YrhL